MQNDKCTVIPIGEKDLLPPSPREVARSAGRSYSNEKGAI